MGAGVGTGVAVGGRVGTEVFAGAGVDTGVAVGGRVGTEVFAGAGVDTGVAVGAGTGVPATCVAIPAATVGSGTAGTLSLVQATTMTTRTKLVDNTNG